MKMVYLVVHLRDLYKSLTFLNEELLKVKNFNNIIKNEQKFDETGFFFSFPIYSVQQFQCISHFL